MLGCTQSEAMTQPPARGTGQPEEKPEGDATLTSAWDP